MDMGFRTWNVRCLCKAGSVKLEREEAKYNLYIVAVQVTWDNDGTEPQQTIIHFSMKIGKIWRFFLDSCGRLNGGGESMSGEHSLHNYTFQTGSITLHNLPQTVFDNLHNSLQ
jgi:hypothetical protein